MAKTASSYNITKRADGRWKTRIMVDGKEIYIYGQTKNEVQSKLKAKVYEIEQAKAAQLTNFMQAEKLTVGQWADRKSTV